jgi:hypothetical protein
MTHDLSRRGVLAASLITAAGEVSSPGLAAAGERGHDPRLTAEGQVKLGATLDGSPAFWTYSGVIYAVLPDRRPLPILSLSGCQSSWATALGEGDYRVAGAIVTFFRDPGTDAFLDVFDNAFTGKRNRVSPNILRGGALIYPANGASAHAQGQINAAVIAPRGFAPSDPAQALGSVRWKVAGPSIMLMTDRSWNALAQPQLEAQTQSADRALFFDPRVRRLPARFTATTIMPWMTWMEMDGIAGHLVWHSSGEKLFSLDDLPSDYRNHAGSQIDILSTPPEG